MKQELYFCKSWFRAKMRPTEIWSEVDARLAHEKGLPYTVLVASAEAPFCFLEVTRKAFCVGFLDESLRESLTYDFQEVEPGKLFLSMATHWEFESGSDQVINGASYIFSADGTVQVKREFFNPHRVEVANSKIDVRTNFSATPKFGEFDDLIRVDRS
jgi:hypothetical protein